jgi:hypothetical protein
VVNLLADWQCPGSKREDHHTGPTGNRAMTSLWGGSLYGLEEGLFPADREVDVRPRH